MGFLRYYILRCDIGAISSWGRCYSINSTQSSSDQFTHRRRREWNDRPSRGGYILPVASSSLPRGWLSNCHDGLITLNFKPNQRLAIRQSLGIAGVATIAGGSILLLPFIGFLLFLWGGRGRAPGGAQATTFWRTIMLNGWAIQSVTLSSHVLRAITASQAAVCVSLLAALLVERRRSPVSKIAKLSLLRGMSGSPLELLKTAFPLELRNIRKESVPELVLTFILTLVSLAVQFSSTILLSDFGSAILIQFPTRTSHNVALSESTLNTTFFGSYRALDQRYGWPTFGGQGAVVSWPNTNISDTGVHKRAFLPYEKDNRMKLRSFNGPTAVMSTRISCIPPKLDATFSPIYPDDTYAYGSINGTISFDDTFRDAGISANQCTYAELHNKTVCLPREFACTVGVGAGVFAAPAPLTTWAPSLCHLAIPVLEKPTGPRPGTKGTKFKNIQDVLVATAGRWSKDSDPWHDPAYWAFLVMATDSNLDLFQYMNETGRPMLPLRPSGLHGEWSSFVLEEGSMINVTLCSAGFNMSLAYVELSTVDEPREPSVGLNALTKSLDAQDVQDMVGASNIQDPGTRGILTLDTIQYLNSSSSSSTGPESFQPNLGTGSFGSFLFYNSLALWSSLGSSVRLWSDGLSAVACTSCWAWGSFLPRDVAVLFTRIINTSGNAALAIDAVFYAITVNWYYDLLPAFDVSGTVEASFSKECSIPKYWQGIVAVISALVIHLICVLVITIRYVKYTRYTRQGNIWHAISQLVSMPTYEILGSSNEKTDRDVSEELGMDNVLVGIDRSVSGRVEVIVTECGKGVNKVKVKGR
ncbi:hypothetical protein GGS20DRAFT_449969 [Poronia punctata]|nr:hypothetical protein GGS20DRAFT_449969 [Poronia punctata]